MKNRMKPLKIFRQVLKVTRIKNIVIAFLIVFCVVAGIIMYLDPGINNYGDALWYCFVATTTIGFGDFTVVNPIARILTVMLYIFTLVLLALLTAITTQITFELIKANQDEAMTVFQDDLEHLEYLPPERLAEMSAIVRRRRNRR